MRALVVSATALEIRSVMAKKWEDISFLVTGVGMVSTAFSLTRFLSNQQVDLVVNVGIAGAVHTHLQLGSVVQVVGDCFSELGAENNDAFLSIDELLLGHQKVQSKQSDEVQSLVASLQKVNGVTVNKVHGNDTSIQMLKKLYPDVGVESMESAAVMYVCEQLKLPCLVLRSISNYVEPRNKENWRIPEAIQQLNNYLFELLSKLQNI